MAYEIRNNSGSAFKNKRKENEKHPDFTGEGLINNVPMWINAWAKKDKNGNAFFSFAFKEKQGHGKPVDKHNEAKANGYQQGDDCPF